MAAFIPEDKIQEIQNAADILEVVSDSVALKKTGKNYQGLCPFHAEKTPSFSVNPSKQIFYCFGCGAGGNVFSFLMKREGMTFPEAVRDLARRYGVHIPAPSITPEQKRRMSEREQLLTVNRLARDFYKENLKSTEGQKARAYLSKRGFDKGIIEKFHIGFAPDAWGSLEGFFNHKKVPPGLAQKTGLIVPRKNGNGHYDAFRNRVMFPILNMNRQVIGFGGRVLDDSHPKYLNSPETPVYNKRRSLYGIDQAKHTARENETVYVVEGYLDLLAMSQYGMINTVATLGTALTGEHAKLLRGLVGTDGRVILVFDSDAAGIKAAERSVEVFAKEYVDAYILVLGDGHDPDSFLHEHGSETFKTTAGKALSTVSFLIESAVNRHGLTLDGKVRVIRDVQGPLASIEDPVARSLYIKSLSERIGVDETAVLEKIHGLLKETAAPGAPSVRENDQKASGGGSRSIERKGNVSTVLSKQDRLEARIVSMMLQFPTMIDEVAKRHLMDFFSNKSLELIARTILENDRDRENPAALIGKIQSEEIRALASSLSIGDYPWDTRGCIRLMDQFESSRNRSQGPLPRDISAEDHEILERIMRETRIRKDRNRVRPKGQPAG